MRARVAPTGHSQGLEASSLVIRMMSATTGAVSPALAATAQAVSETAGDDACAIVAAMPARRPDPQRLLAAVTAQREAVGAEPYAGPVTAAALGAACLGLVIEAIDAGQQPLREALRAATIHALGLLEAGAPPATPAARRRTSWRPTPSPGSCSRPGARAGLLQWRAARSGQAARARTCLPIFRSCRRGHSTQCIPRTN